MVIPVVPCQFTPLHVGHDIFSMHTLSGQAVLVEHGSHFTWCRWHSAMRGTGSLFGVPLLVFETLVDFGGQDLEVVDSSDRCGWRP